jgi:predicted Zn-dependent peptidase
MIRRLLPVLFALSPLLLRGQALEQAFTLPTGLKCILVESHERPLIRMELVVRWDPAGDPLVTNGQLGFLAGLLENSGAGPFSRAEFNRAGDDLGVTLGFDGRRDAFHWGLVTDSRSQEPAFELLAHAVFRPVFDRTVMEAQRQVLLKRAAGTSLRDLALNRFLWNLQDPKVTLVPGGAGLERLELIDLLSLHRRLIRPENALLVLYGDLSLAQARELASLHLGVWGPTLVPAPLKVFAEPLPGPHFAAVLEGGSGAELWAGVQRVGTSAAGVEEVLAILLERTSRTPTTGLKLSFLLEDGGPLLIKAEGRDAARDTLVAGLVEALAQLRTQGFSAEDLGRAKVQWRARKAALPLHPELLVHQILRKAPGPALDQAVEALTVKDVNAAMTAWLEPARLRFLLLGGDAGVLQAAKDAGLGAASLVKP